MDQENTKVAVSPAKQFAHNFQSQYMTAVKNYFQDEQRAMSFLSAIVSDLSRNPGLAECERTGLMNSYLIMAQLRFMPSSVSGEAYILPYKNKKKGITEAQFQIGYKGLVTLFYRSGAKSVNSEIVYEKDKFSYINGEVHHAPDVFSKNRGDAIGAYVIVELSTGGKVTKVMSGEDILDIARNFSKSYYEWDDKNKKYTTNVSKSTPWNPNNDPELWMWKKTVLKQAAKLVPQNDELMIAITKDNEESNIKERQDRDRRHQEAIEIAETLKIKNITKPQDENQAKQEVETKVANNTQDSTK